MLEIFCWLYKIHLGTKHVTGEPERDIFLFTFSAFFARHNHNSFEKVRSFGILDGCSRMFYESKELSLLFVYIYYCFGSLIYEM